MALLHDEVMPLAEARADQSERARGPDPDPEAPIEATSDGRVDATAEDVPVVRAT
jgi:hypothetical protein